MWGTFKMSNPIVKKNNNVSNVRPTSPNVYNNNVGHHQGNPPNHTLKSVNNLPQDINYVDVTYRNKIRNLHLTYLVAIVVAGFLGFQGASIFVKPKKVSVAVEMAQAALNNKLQINTVPQMNSFDAKVLRNEIYEKYDKAREGLRTKHFAETAAKNRSTDNFYNSEEYFQMRRQYENAKIELDGQQAIEMCDKIQSSMACREASDYKSSKRRVASSEH